METGVEEIIREIAEKRGISVDELLQGANASMELATSELPKGNRLATAERHLVEGRIWNKDHLAILLANNPLQSAEILALVDEIKHDLREEYGLPVPDYEIDLNHTFRSEDFEGILGMVLWEDRKMILPDESSGLYTPLGIAHELAHTAHMEESELYRMIRAARAEDDINTVKQLNRNGNHIIEGFATFVERLYAELRDGRLGTDFYQTMTRELESAMRFHDELSKYKSRVHYYVGANWFQEIHERKGLDATVDAAMTLTTDDELRETVLSLS